jgi:hypothetical protein
MTHFHSVLELGLASHSENRSKAAAWPRDTLQFVGRVPGSVLDSRNRKMVFFNSLLLKAIRH